MSCSRPRRWDPCASSAAPTAHRWLRIGPTWPPNSRTRLQTFRAVASCFGRAWAFRAIFQPVLPLGAELTQRALGYGFEPEVASLLRFYYEALGVPHADARPRLESVLDVLVRVHGLPALVDVLSDLRDAIPSHCTSSWRAHSRRAHLRSRRTSTAVWSGPAVIAYSRAWQLRCRSEWRRATRDAWPSRERIGARDNRAVGSRLASRYELSPELAGGLTGIETVTDAVLNPT